MLVCRIGGGGAGHVRCGGNGGALPFGLRSFVAAGTENFPVAAAVVGTVVILLLLPFELLLLLLKLLVVFAFVVDVVDGDDNDDNIDELLLLFKLLCKVDTLFTELAPPICGLLIENCSFNVETLLAEPKLVLTPAAALDGATLNGNVVRFVFDTLRIGGGGGLIFGGLGGATVGRLIGGFGA